MSDNPKYKILKEYPGLPVGELIQQHEKGGHYTIICIAPGKSRVWLPEKLVESNPEYFQLIEVAIWTDSDLLAFAKWCWSKAPVDISIQEWQKSLQPEARKPQTAEWETPKSLINALPS